jgi:putative membrane protein
VLQLLVRMRLDLLVMLGLCLASMGLKSFLAATFVRTTALPMLGIAVSIFVGFRNTQAINRWWEARSLWGAVVNQSRHWRDALLALLDPAAQAGPRQRLLRLQVLAVWLLNLELRNYGLKIQRQRVLRLVADLGLAADVTLQQVSIARSELLRRLHAQGALSDLGLDALLRSSEAFTTALGGLQKIRNTPIPPAYDVFVRLICWLYGYALFYEFTRSDAPLTGACLFLGFLVAERIGAYVEGPFDRDGSSFSLPLNQICLGISRDLLDDDSPFADLPLCHDPSTWT